jgi:hypothetical protein
LVHPEKLSAVPILLLTACLDDAVRLAIRLEYATVAWNSTEVFVTIGLGIAARSVALVAFGLDSLIEIFASSVCRRRPNTARVTPVENCAVHHRWR